MGILNSIGGLLGFGSGNPPPAPDYTAAATAQGQANKEAAIATSNLNNPNVINPYGTQTYTPGATPSDRPTLTQTLSPEQQALYEKQTQTQGLLGDLGIQSATSLQGVLGQPVDYSGAPSAPGSAEATRQKVIDAMMGRVDTDIQRDRESKRSELIARGIPENSPAFDVEMERFDRRRTDALQQAQLAGGQEASRDFGMDSERRRQAISEMLSQRQIPLNELSALMTGAQVQNPFSVPGYSAGATVAPAPTFGATQLASQYNTDIYNADVGRQNALMQGLFGLGTNVAMAAPFLSDRRLKSNIRRIATHPLGIGIYEYDIFGRHEIGVMAQEVLEVKPEAVITMPSGFYAVDYGRL